MDENYEAAILQSFIQLQATKHGDHLLKALPVIASSMPAIASSVPAIASSKQAYGSSHQPTQVIIKPKNEMIEDYCGDSMGSDPRHSDQDEYCNPHEDSQIISSNQIFLQKLQQYQNFQHLQKLQQFENERHHMENEREDLEPHRSIFSHVSHKQDLLDIKPVQVIREAHRPEILTGKPVFVITSVQSVNTSVIKKNGNPLVAKKDEINENLPKAEIPVKPSKCSKPVKVVKPLKRVISKPSADGVQPKSEDGNPLCAVCGEKAGKHSYYGGQVCASCRAFFRRAVQSGCHVSFCCVNKSDSCAILYSPGKTVNSVGMRNVYSVACVLTGSFLKKKGLEDFMAEEREKTEMVRFEIMTPWRILTVQFLEAVQTNLPAPAGSSLRTK